MEYLYYLIAVVILFVILKLISLPMRLILKLLINAIMGGVVLFAINLIGAQFGFALDINWLTALVVGFLGLPGVIIVVILHFLM